MQSELKALVKRLRSNTPLLEADFTVFDCLRRRSKERSIASLLANYAIEVNDHDNQHRLYLIQSEALTYSGDFTGGLAALLACLRRSPFAYVNINGLSALWRNGVDDVQLGAFFTLGAPKIFSNAARSIAPPSDERARSASTRPTVIGDCPPALRHLEEDIATQHLRGAVLTCGRSRLVIADGFFATIDAEGIIPNCSTRHGYILGDKIVRQRFDQLTEDCQHLGGRVAFICDAFDSSNYAHWLLDWLPRLELFRLCGIQPDVILSMQTGHSFQDDSLRYLLQGHEAVIDKRTHSCFRCDELHFVDSCFHSHMHPSHRASPWSLCFFEDLAGKIVASRSDGVSRRIYVSRQESRRRIFNHAECVALLTRYGFQELFLEAMSFEDQVIAFGRADAVVGAHGAGLANLVFCHAGTHVLEIFGRFGGDGFALLACRKGLSYSAIGPGTSTAKSDTSLASEDITVDLSRLAAWLRMIA